MADHFSIITVQRFRWKCSVVGCDYHATSIGSYDTEAEAKVDARAHARRGHRADGSHNSHSIRITFKQFDG